jgi:hypothetical protein
LEESKLRHYLSLAVRQSDIATREAEDLKGQLSTLQADKLALERTNKDLLARIESNQSPSVQQRLSVPVAVVNGHGPVVLQCVQGDGHPATVWCTDCADALCSSCDSMIHRMNTKRRSTHLRSVLHGM